MNHATRTSARHNDTHGKTENGVSNVCHTYTARDRLVRLAYRFLWNQDDAEDVAQDALTVALKRGADLRDDAKWWSWICRIVVHRCHEMGRRQLRWQKHKPMVVRGIEGKAPAPSFEDEGRPSERMRTCIDKLPKRQREVIVLRHFEGMSYERIAEVLEIKPTTVRVHARAGREALRTLLVKP
jgi:RNA polymerase sigma-70 factor (ECF subfamily)